MARYISPHPPRGGFLSNNRVKPGTSGGHGIFLYDRLSMATTAILNDQGVPLGMNLFLRTYKYNKHAAAWELQMTNEES